MSEINENIDYDCSSCKNECKSKEDCNNSYESKADNKITKIDEKIAIDKNYFEHLLNCLANQKFIGEAPPCGDAMAMDKNDYLNVQRENQKIIDKAWNRGMFILNLENIKDKNCEKMVNAYIIYWNSNAQKYLEDCNKDMEEFPNDKNIDFKWIQLVDQEIRMWIRLACWDANIDEDNQIYSIKQVDKEDFDGIVIRRGLTQRMTDAMRETLKHVRIGDNL